MLRVAGAGLIFMAHGLIMCSLKVIFYQRKRAMVVCRGKPGEIRETILPELPEHHVYVGCTGVDLDLVRAFNSTRPLR